MEAANVTGPSGEQVKGSRYATNFYAGRYRFRRGSNYGGGGRRFFSRRNNYNDRSGQESNTEDVKGALSDEKHDGAGSEINKEQQHQPSIRSKKYSKNRKFLDGGVGVEGGRLRRSNSLPSDVSFFE